MDGALPVFALRLAPLPEERVEGEAVGDAVAVAVVAAVAVAVAISAAMVAPALAALVAGRRQEGDVDLWVKIGSSHK